MKRPKGAKLRIRRQANLMALVNRLAASLFVSILIENGVFVKKDGATASDHLVEIFSSPPL